MLDNYVRNVGAKPFTWGSHDCVTFVCGWIKYATGKDVKKHLPIWDDQRSALRAQLYMGGLAEGANKLLGCSKPVGITGDIVLLKAPHSCFGILNETKVLVVTQAGLNCISVDFVDRIWGLK